MREKKPLSEKLAVWCVTLALITLTIFGLVVGGPKFMIYVAGAIFLIICFVALINLYYLVAQLIVKGVKRLGIMFEDWGRKDAQNQH